VAHNTSILCWFHSGRYIVAHVYTNATWLKETVPGGVDAGRRGDQSYGSGYNVSISCRRGCGHVDDLLPFILFAQDLVEWERSKIPEYHPEADLVFFSHIYNTWYAESAIDSRGRKVLW